MKFTLDCLVEGKPEHFVFEFENNDNIINIVFSSNHSGETFMQIAILTIVDYLMAEINTAINLN